MSGATLGFILFSLVIGCSAWAKPLYVHSVKAAIKSEPKTSASKVVDVKRGQLLTQLKKKGIWLQVKTQDGQKGWISKLFVKSKPPVGQAELFDNKGASAAKSSRRRSSSYAVSAATRGLTASTRTRGARELFRSNPQALKRMEQLQIQDSRLERFQKAGEIKGN